MANSDTVDARAIVRELDFLFGDGNYHTDQVLLSLLDAKGFVGLDVLLQHSRRLQELTNNSVDAVRRALRLVPSTILQLSRDTKLIRRVSTEVRIVRFLDDIFKDTLRYPLVDALASKNRHGYIWITSLFELFPELAILAWANVYHVASACIRCSPRYVQISPDQLRVRRKTRYEEIATQIEFYFSENNLPYDKHLRSLIDSEGYVSVKDLLGFPKLKTLTDDPLMVLEALKTSSSVEACLRLPKPKELLTDGDVSSGAEQGGSFAPMHSVAVRLIPRERQLTRLLEHWFSDKNLARDRFLQRQIEESPLSFVPISVLLSFNRLSAMKATLEEVAAAAAVSSDLEVSGDGQMIRRKSALPPPPSLQRKGKPQPLTLSFAAANDDPEAGLPLPSPNTQHAILQLVEYYFGDENFLFDRNLQQLAVDEPSQSQANGIIQGLHWKSPSNDRIMYGGWVPLSELIKLQRLQLLRPTLADIRAAVQFGAQTVVLSEDGLFVRRRHPLPATPPIITSEGIKAGLCLPIPENPAVFTVMEYNVLAEHLTREEWFPYTTDEVRDWRFRSRLIRKQVRYHLPDLLCLEEVQSHVSSSSQQVSMNVPPRGAPLEPGAEQNHVTWFKDWLQKDGYQVHYIRKALPDNQLREGVDIGNILAWRTQVFELLDVKDIVLSREILAALRRYAERCAQFMPVERLEQVMKQSAAQLTCGYLQVASMVRLRHRHTGRHLIFCGVHITANYRAPYTQVMQVQSCLEALELFSMTQVSPYSPPQGAPVVLCGDFNSTPERGSIMLLANGQLKPGHGELEMAVQRGIMLPYPQPKHNLQLLSSHHWAAHKSGGLICGFPLQVKSSAPVPHPMLSTAKPKQGVVNWPWQQQQQTILTSASGPVTVHVDASGVRPTGETEQADRRLTLGLMNLTLSTPSSDCSRSERSLSSSSASSDGTLDQDINESTLEEHRGYACATSPRSPGIPQLPLTNYTHEFSGTLDYIWFTPHRGLQAVAALGGLPTSVLAEYTGLPSQRFPSDHLPVICQLAFN